MQAWHELADELLLLQRELQQLGLWSLQAPSAAALASREPFCVDTLAFEQWMQWVFIPRMAQILEQGQGMPGGCSIQPMGEEAFAHLGRQAGDLLLILGRIDRVATRLAVQP